MRRETSPRALSGEYVQRLFDGYAGDFDRQLVEELRYDNHCRLVDVLVGIASGLGASALDLGCGAGLCGPLVRPMARGLAGVDLSPRMLEKGRALGVYDRLVLGDAVELLRSDDARHDLLVAADVFIYVGDLEPVFAAAMMERGTFCFSVELCDDDAGFRLQPSLRYAHSQRYLLQLAARHGFEVLAIQRAAVREDRSQAVDGLCVCLRR